MFYHSYLVFLQRRYSFRASPGGDTKKKTMCLVLLFAVISLVLHSTNRLTSALTTNYYQSTQSEPSLWKSSTISSSDICPPNFVAIGDTVFSRKPFCILITKPQQWSNVCVSYGCTDDYYDLGEEEQYFVDNFLREMNIYEFWMTVKKEKPFGYPLRMLPGPGWGTPLDFEKEDQETHLDFYQTSGNCLLVLHGQHNFSIPLFKDCSEYHPQLCIYKRETMLGLSCPKNEYTTRYSHYQDHCFKIVQSTNIDTGLRLFNVDSHRKLQLLQKLARKSKANCKFTVIQTNITDQLVNLNTTIYTQHVHFAMKDDGVITLVRSFDCVAYERVTSAAVVKRPELNLSFDRIRQRLLLVISNGRQLWRERDKDVGVVCYTDADTELLKKADIKRKIWPPDNDRRKLDDDNIYEVKLYGDFPGLYWCEGHVVPNFRLVRSDKIFANKKDKHVHVYSIVLNIKLLDHDNILQKSTLKRIVKQFKEHVKSTADMSGLRVADRIKGMKIMEIESVETNSDKYSMVLHVAVKYRDFDSSDEEDENTEMGGPKETLDQLHRLFEKADNEQYTYLGINSTEFCFPEDMHAGFQWPLARVGQTVAPQTLCLIEPTGLPLRRRCIGNRIYGGYWEQLNGTAFQCATNVRTETLKLYNYQTNPIQHEAVAEILTDLIGVIDSTAALVPADVFYLSKTIENIKSTLFNENSNNGTVFGNKRESLYSRLSAILNRVMYVNESILLNSQVALNATNILLDATDAIINQISVTNSTTAEDGSIGGNNSNPVGVEHGDNKIDRMINLNGSLLYRTGRLVLLIADPAVANVTGIALLKDVQYYGDTEEPVPAGTDSFDEYQIRLITADESEEDIMEEENLEIASYIPSTLLENIKLLAETEDANNTKQLRVVITVFFNDHIFKEVTNGSVSKANSKVISITLPGFGSDLPGELPIFFRDTDVNKSSNCGYWDFNVNEIEAMPQWSYKRCYMVQQDHDLSLCKCSHLTSFSRLCMDMQYVESTGVSQKFIGDQGNIVLDVITAIGCTLSLLGVGGIFITAIIFPNWRSTANSKVLLQLSLAIAIEMFIVFLEGPDIERDKESSKIQCTLLGASFHYIILVTFMWMLIIGYLQFLRYIKVLGRLRPSHCIFRASILCWCLPILPVLAFATWDYTHYHKQNNFSDICYPHGPALYFGLILPISLIIITNATCFILIIYNVFHIPDNLQRSTDKRITFSQLRLSSFLFFLLGLPWIFGMMITAGAGSLFPYLFCLTAPLQGFILFVYFIIMDPAARKLWSLKLAEYDCSKSDKGNIDMCEK